MSGRSSGWWICIRRTLTVALRFRAITMLVLLATIGLNVYLFIRIPKGFFPQQDNGRIQGSILADQDTSFQAMDKIMLPMINIVAADPAVDTVNRIHGRQHLQHGASVHFAEAARRTENLSRPGHRAAAAQAGQGARRYFVSAGCAGSARRRAAK